MYDVAIIGGGVIGSFIARELSRYSLKICVLEGNADVAMGASGANSGIVHGGYDPVPGSMKARFNVEGCNMMKKVTDELSVPYRNNGSLVVAFSDEDLKTIEILKKRGEENGLDCLEIVSKEKLKEIEPNISDKAVGALICHKSGIVCPYELNVAAMENAITNGAELFTEYFVKNIERENNGGFCITTNNGVVDSKYIINAAGVGADEIYNLAIKCASDKEAAESKKFKILPRKGEYMLMDKLQGGLAYHVIFHTPGKMGKGILVSPTVDGNLLMGPTSVNINDRFGNETTQKGFDDIKLGALKSVPSINTRDVITSFTGIRAASDQDDFIIGTTPIEGFINVAGIESPGLTSAPAIGVYVANMVAEMAGAEKKIDFNPERKKHHHFSNMTNDEKQKLIDENSAYANIICRCEKITEGEIIDAIHRPCGARTVDGVKRRTRSGMGRCQGGFCSPRVIEILARELDKPIVDIKKSSGGSYILTGKTK